MHKLVNSYRNREREDASVGSVEDDKENDKSIIHYPDERRKN
jgi:hypothetical protein